MKCAKTQWKQALLQTTGFAFLVDVKRTVKEKIVGKRYGEVRKFKKVRKFASSNLKFRSSKFKFTEILICNPGVGRGFRAESLKHGPASDVDH